MQQIKPDYLIYLGTIGFGLGILTILVFLYRRIFRLINLFTKTQVKKIGVVASFRNLLLIFLLVAVSGTVLFMGYFFRAYSRFTFEEPVAKIKVEPLKGPYSSRVTLIRLAEADSTTHYDYLIKGDQWVLEGDILKWDPWMNFLGLDTRYRLTRIRGRYIRSSDEKNLDQTIYSLAEDEDNPGWHYLYEFGQHLPFVSAVYGNASFQSASHRRTYLVFVSQSGFVVREQER